MSGLFEAWMEFILYCLLTSIFIGFVLAGGVLGVVIVLKVCGVM